MKMRPEGQITDTPSHFSATSQTPAGRLQTSSFSFSASAGQSRLMASQVSGLSHSPTAGLPHHLLSQNIARRRACRSASAAATQSPALAGLDPITASFVFHTCGTDTFDTKHVCATYRSERGTQIGDTRAKFRYKKSGASHGSPLSTVPQLSVDSRKTIIQVSTPFSHLVTGFSQAAISTPAPGSQANIRYAKPVRRYPRLPSVSGCRRAAGFWDRSAQPDCIHRFDKLFHRYKPPRDNPHRASVSAKIRASSLT